MYNQRAMLPQRPLISIVCTNFNKGAWIRDAIKSFLNQKTEFDYEIILIDDGSTDKSPKIIKDYAERYPDRIRAFYNSKNLGITKTWIKVCKKAKGKYIARCDADDYWIDEHKLQKQVDLLEKSRPSLWCSTDYNIITAEGKLIHKSAFENKVVDRAASYAQMLATKGFTNASTWLVDANLMREVNSEIDSSAVDDTFNIQLELFNKTKLTYLPEATVVLRISEGSDSKPTEIEKIRSRNARLLQTQLEYIEKYKDIDYEEILKILLHRNMQYETWAIERLRTIDDQKCYIHRLEDHIKELERLIHAITKSRSYRLGTTITAPWRMVKGQLRMAHGDSKDS